MSDIFVSIHRKIKYDFKSKWWQFWKKQSVNLTSNHAEGKTFTIKNNDFIKVNNFIKEAKIEFELTKVPTEEIEHVYNFPLKDGTHHITLTIRPKNK